MGGLRAGLLELSLQGRGPDRWELLRSSVAVHHGSRCSSVG